MGSGRPAVTASSRGGDPQGPLRTHDHFEGVGSWEDLRRKVISFLTCLGVFCTDSSDKEDAIEEDEEEDEDEDDDDDDLEVKEENGVLILNDANFDNFVADKDTVLLEFYAPW